MCVLTREESAEAVLRQRTGEKITPILSRTVDCISELIEARIAGFEEPMRSEMRISLWQLACEKFLVQAGLKRQAP